MKASSESGLWATEISRGWVDKELEGIDERVLDMVSLSVPVEDENLMRGLRQDPPRSHGGGDGGNTLENLSREEGKHRDRNDGCRRLVDQNRKPKRSRGENQDTASYCSERQRHQAKVARESLLNQTGRKCGKRVRNQIATSWAEQLRHSSWSMGTKDRQPRYALEQIEDERGRGAPASERQGQKHHPKGLKRNRDGSEPEGNRDVGTNRHQQAAADYQGGIYRPGAPETINFVM